MNSAVGLFTHRNIVLLLYDTFDGECLHAYHHVYVAVGCYGSLDIGNISVVCADDNFYVGVIICRKISVESPRENAYYRLVKA